MRAVGPGSVGRVLLDFGEGLNRAALGSDLADFVEAYRASHRSPLLEDDGIRGTK